MRMLFALTALDGPGVALRLNEAAAWGRVGGWSCSGLFTTWDRVAGRCPRYEQDSTVN